MSGNPKAGTKRGSSTSSSIAASSVPPSKRSARLTSSSSSSAAVILPSPHPSSPLLPAPSAPLLAAGPPTPAGGAAAAVPIPPAPLPPSLFAAGGPPPPPASAALASGLAVVPPPPPSAAAPPPLFAPPPPPLPPKKGGGSKGKKPPAAPAEEAPLAALPPAGDFDLLPMDCIGELLTFLDPASLFNFSMSCKMCGDRETIPDRLWKSALSVADPFREYFSSVDAETRLKLEAFHGTKKVVSALMSDKCSNCNELTQGFEVLSCRRACIECWQCMDSGQNGLDSTSPFALSTVSFATTHFLVNEKEIKSTLMVLEVNDPTKASGLDMTTLHIVQINKAKALGLAKFGGKEGLAAEKTQRAAKSEAGYEAKLKVARETPGAKLPAVPDMVRKEREKTNPQHRNYVCLNQNRGPMLRVCESYGYHFSVRGLNALRQPPSIVVSKDPVASVLAAYPTLAGPANVFTNLVEAIAACKSGSTLVIDAEVDLPLDVAACDQERCKQVLNGEGKMLSIGGMLQKNVLYISENLKIVGTPRSAIFSNSAVFWTASHSHLSIEGLRIESGIDSHSTDEFGMGLGTPLVNAGTMSIKNCTVISAHSYCLLADGMTDVSDSKLVGCGGMCIFFDDELDSKGRQQFKFVGNSLIASEYCDVYFINGKFADESAFIEKLKRDNEFDNDDGYGHDFTGPYGRSQRYGGDY